MAAREHSRQISHQTASEGGRPLVEPIVVKLHAKRLAVNPAPSVIPTLISVISALIICYSIMARVSKKPRRPVQLDLPLARPLKPPGRGGSREGAGRKPGTGRRLVRHRAREAHSSVHPLHVVMRSKFKPLRSQFVFPAIRKALAQATRARKDFRITQFSVQGDHVHLIVEAGSKSALSRGMQGLAIRIVRAVNRLVNRSGKLWADRFFSRELKSPRVVRNALAYVLNNFRKHRAQGAARIDPYSSAPYFNGFRELGGTAPSALPPSRNLPLVPRGVAPPANSDELPVVRASTWLGGVGWRRGGVVSFTFLGEG